MSVFYTDLNLSQVTYDTITIVHHLVPIRSGEVVVSTDATYLPSSARDSFVATGIGVSEALVNLRAILMKLDVADDLTRRGLGIQPSLLLRFGRRYHVSGRARNDFKELTRFYGSLSVSPVGRGTLLVGSWPQAPWDVDDHRLPLVVCLNAALRAQVSLCRVSQEPDPGDLLGLMQTAGFPSRDDYPNDENFLRLREAIHLRSLVLGRSAIEFFRSVSLTKECSDLKALADLRDTRDTFLDWFRSVMSVPKDKRLIWHLS